MVVELGLVCAELTLLSLPPSLLLAYLSVCLSVCACLRAERESVFPPCTPPEFDWLSHYTHHYPQDPQGWFMPWFGRGVLGQTSPHGVADIGTDHGTDPIHTPDWFDDRGRRNPSPQV